MEIRCTVCHLAQTQGDMTTLQLFLPREEICFGCHEKTMLLQQHTAAAKRMCVDCHDAHSSNRRMLLRDPLDTSRSNSLMLPSGAKSTARKTVDQP